ncbi:hypothetical protein QZJ93_19060 [Acinetobacter baumannii]|nr:hypothetical protein [Acinetobacter baumannii]
MGGDNVYAYAPNPVGWIDPLGLNSKSKNSEEENDTCKTLHK